MNILITGGTGFIGSALTDVLVNRGHCLTILTRQKNTLSSDRRIRYLAWNCSNSPELIAAMEENQAVVNLAGERVGGKRWTPAQLDRIEESRIDVTASIITAISKAKEKPKVLVNASAVGYYGPRGEEVVDEKSRFGEGALSHVCHRWEMEAARVKEHGVRLVVTRIGIVLGEEGGMLEKMAPSFRYYLGGIPGSGTQWISWIHRDDLIRILTEAIENELLHGTYNATSPNPVRMSEFCQTLAKALHRPCYFRIPAFLLKLMYGQQAELFLTGQKVIPRRLLGGKFEFQHSELKEALKDIF